MRPMLFYYVSMFSNLYYSSENIKAVYQFSIRYVKNLLFIISYTSNIHSILMFLYDKMAISNNHIVFFFLLCYFHFFTFQVIMLFISSSSKLTFNLLITLMKYLYQQAIIKKYTV